jgi:predicted phage terminase large subunit-like protein
VTADDILGLTVTCLAARYDDPKPTPDLHIEMWEECCSDHTMVAIAAPRGHAKSTAITFAYALALLLFRESQHLLLLSSNETLSADFLHEIKTELQENDILNQHFGPFNFLKDSTTEIVVQFKDKAKFRVICKGSNQRMRGLKWERKRPDTVIGDDLEDDEIVLNEERRDRFRRWFYGAVRPITKDGGKIRLAGTILHLDSLLERAMPREKSKHTQHTPLKTFSTDPKRRWRSVKYRAHDEQFEHILWPEMFPKEKLQGIRDEYAEFGLLDVYGQEYLNDPVDQSTAHFRREDFIPMGDDDYSLRKTYYVGGDLAISEKKRSAYSSFTVGGVDSGEFLHIVDQRRGRWDTLQIIEEMFNLYERYNFELMRIESENIEKTLRPVLEAEMVRRDIFFPYDFKPALKDKVARMRAFQFRMRAGRVRFDKRASWYPEYEEELAHFPKWPYKDQVDSSAWLGETINEQHRANTDAEIEDMEYDAMVDRDMYKGVNLVTGY